MVKPRIGDRQVQVGNLRHFDAIPHNELGELCCWRLEPQKKCGVLLCVSDEAELRI